MERSKANKKKFQMRSPFKGSIADFMAMGKTLGSSKISPSTTVDPSKYYKAPKKKVEKTEESAVDQDKRETAEKRNKKRLAEKNKKETLQKVNSEIKYTPSKIKSLNKYPTNR